MKRLLNVFFIAFFSEEWPSRQLFDYDSIDRMPKIEPGLLLFHYESLLSKVYRRDTSDSSSSVYHGITFCNSVEYFVGNVISIM